MASITYQDLAYKIVRARGEHGWTQKELAERLGVHPNQLYRYESGKNFPRPALLRKMCDVLQVEPSWLGAVQVPRHALTVELEGAELAKAEEGAHDLGLTLEKFVNYIVKQKLRQDLDEQVPAGALTVETVTRMVEDLKYRVDRIERKLEEP